MPESEEKDLREAIHLSQSGRKQEARKILMGLLKQNPRWEIAWLWLADTALVEEERRLILQQGLKINPGSQLMKKALAALTPPFQQEKGVPAEEKAATLDDVSVPSPSPVEKIAEPGESQTVLIKETVKTDSVLIQQELPSEVSQEKEATAFTLSKEEKISSVQERRIEESLISDEEVRTRSKLDEEIHLGEEEEKPLLHPGDDETPMLNVQTPQLHVSEEETLLGSAALDEVHLNVEEAQPFPLEDGAPVFSSRVEPGELFLGIDEEKRVKRLAQLARADEVAAPPAAPARRKRSPWIWLVLSLLITAIVATVIAAVYLWTSEQRRLNEALQTLQPPANIQEDLTLTPSLTQTEESSPTSIPIPETPTSTPPINPVNLALAPENIQQITILSQHALDGTLLAISPDWSLAAAARGEQVALWRFMDGTPLGEYALQPNNKVLAAAISPDNLYLFVAREDYSIEKWNLANGDRVFSVPLDAQTLNDLRSAESSADFIPGIEINLSPDGSRLAGGMYGVFLYMDSETGVLLRQLKPEIPRSDANFENITQVYHVDFSADGRLLAVGFPATTYILSADNGASVQTLITDFLSRPVFAPDGQTLLESFNGSLILVNPTNGNRLEVLEGVPAGASRTSPCAFSPDSRYLAYETYGVNDTIVVALLDLQSNQTQVQLGNFPQPIQSIQFSPDGRLVAIGDADGFSRFYETQTGRELLSIPDLTNLLFSPDGTRLVSVNEGEVTFMGLASGNPGGLVPGSTAIPVSQVEAIPGLKIEEALAFYADDLGYQCSAPVESVYPQVQLWRCGAYNSIFNLHLEIYGTQSGDILWIAADVESAKYNFEPLTSSEKQTAINALKEAAGIPYAGASPEEAVAWVGEKALALEGLFDIRQIHFGSVLFRVSLPNPQVTGYLTIGQAP